MALSQIGRLLGAAAARFASVWVSGSQSQAKRRFTRQMAAAINPGYACPRCEAPEEMIGPIAIPAPVAAESQPRAWARSLGFTVSVTYAWATPVVPPPAPWMIRERKRSQRCPAKAKTTYAIADPVSPIRSAGRRPNRSETRPQNGAERSWAIE